MSFWETVEEVREYRDISRKELAYKADFSLNSISTGIARNSVPSADVACRIAKVLGVSVEFLVTGKSGKKEKRADEQIERKLEGKREAFFKYMDKHSKMMEEFSSLDEPLQKAIRELIHASAANR